jgi:hypothetical protein
MLGFRPKGPLSVVVASGQVPQARLPAGYTSIFKFSKNGNQLYSELLPVWKIERSKPDKCPKFIFAVE